MAGSVVSLRICLYTLFSLASALAKSRAAVMFISFCDCATAGKTASMLPNGSNTEHAITGKSLRIFIISFIRSCYPGHSGVQREQRSNRRLLHRIDTEPLVPLFDL